MDDESAVIHVTKRMLEMGGYAVTGVTAAAEAWGLFETEDWDLIIVDRAMPGMNGEELAERIKQSAPHMPILMITGFPDTVQHRERYTAVVRKPFASAELLRQVALTLTRAT